MVRYAGLHLDWKGIWLCTKTVFLLWIQSTLFRLWLLCVMSVIILVNQLPAFRATWGHMRGYLMRIMKLEMAIICGDAAVIIISSWLTVVKGEPKAPFSITPTPRCGEKATPFSGLLLLPLICTLKCWVLKQRRLKYHFFDSLVWLDLGLNSGLLDHWRTLYHCVNGLVYIYICIYI